jgi:hypothetical protein
VFSRWQSVDMTVLVDGERREGHRHEVFVANGGYAAGGMWIAPEADPGDGWLETVLIGDFNNDGVADLLTNWPEGEIRMVSWQGASGWAAATFDKTIIARSSALAFSRRIIGRSESRPR